MTNPSSSGGGGGSGTLSGFGTTFNAVEGGLSNPYQTGGGGVNPVLRGVEGTTLGGVTTTTFTAADPNAVPADYGAVITWGDGWTSAGTVAVAAGGGFDVTGSHTYATEGAYDVTTSVTDLGSGWGTQGTAKAAIADAALTAWAADFHAAAGTAAGVTLATFTDADPNAAVSDYQASIAWGDGTFASGAVTADPNGGFDVTGGTATGGRAITRRR